MAYTVQLKELLLLGLALLLAYVLLGAWLDRRARARGLWWTALGVAATLATVGLLPPHDVDWLDRAAVQRQGTALAAAVERYRQAHGEYPATLEAAGVVPPRTPFGPMGYRRLVDRGQPIFELRVGDYDRHGFVYVWQSNWAPAAWYLNT